MQGTLYPDVVESGGGAGTSNIKSHHNVGGLPDDLEFELVEPLRTLFKDEVRLVGEQLGLPAEIVWRHPFPGPGLGIRIIGEVTRDRLDILREADAIAREELTRAGLDRDIWQFPVVLLADVRSVGVQGDGRTYGHPVVLRPVTSEDAMTADWARLPVRRAGDDLHPDHQRGRARSTGSPSTSPASPRAPSSGSEQPPEGRQVVRPSPWLTESSLWRERTAWARERAAPLRAFLRTESGSAGVLLAAVVAALVWANVDLASYESVWHADFSIRLGDMQVTRDLRTWINSGLMTLFFLVVGLEARREFDLGDLRERRRFVLPCVAGLVGMAVPAAIYLAVNAGQSSAHGWGVAMSTDTALALGLLALLGRDVPDRVRVFLLTVFVVDDLAALVVIAVVYSDDLDFAPSGHRRRAVRRAAGRVGATRAAALGLCRARARRCGRRCWPAASTRSSPGLAIGLSAPAYSPARERARGGDRAGAAVPRAADAGTRALGERRPHLDAVAQRAAADVLPPVDELSDRSAVRAGQRRHRAQRQLPAHGLHGTDHARRAGRLRRRQAGRAGRRRPRCVTRLSRGRIRPPVGWAAVLGSGTIAGIGFTVALLIADRAFSRRRARRGQARCAVRRRSSHRC